MASNLHKKNLRNPKGRRFRIGTAFITPMDFIYNLITQPFLSVLFLYVLLQYISNVFVCTHPYEKLYEFPFFIRNVLLFKMLHH